jgi:hypothetical protein
MSRTLTLAREEVADVLNAGVEGLRIRPRKQVKTPRQGDGWVTVQRLAPLDFRRSSAVLVVLVTLGPDADMAEELFELWAVAAIDVVTDLPVADVSVEPISLGVDGGGIVNAFTLTLTVEVEQL